MQKINIMIVDDEKILRISLRDNLTEAGYNVNSFDDPLKALADLGNKNYHVVITDIKMPQMNGIELLKNIKRFNQNINVIVMTAYGSIETAVEAMKYSAYDYISKPFKIEELIFKIKRIEEVEHIKFQNENLKEQIQTNLNISKFIGNSPAVQRIHQLIDTVAESNSTVLITGETGTGKELIANILHSKSKRQNQPMIKVSCAILSKDVFESELFGHEKGSFTGAIKDRIGRFEQADGGTIYLDDIDDVPLHLQVKLLRVLQEHEFERVGGNETIKVDFRCIASTKADLLELVREGKFRQDLYYRLNVFPIHIPALRERKEDIPELLKFYLHYFSPNNVINLDEDWLKVFIEFPWLGNVRELRNIAERIYLLSQSNKLDISYLPLEISQSIPHSSEIEFNNKTLDELISNFEKSIIKKALILSNGNKSKAADLLKIPATTLRSKIDKLKI
ncbi:MAG: sigma-54 dependent transcriptional regulator [Candidatus Kapabacteria bacterium]|nr:sigma-54 dependent transcriptional regulator [Candidatus Kapabacteria bacterium]